MQLTKEILQAKLAERTKQRDQAQAELNAVIGAVITLNELLAALDQPEPAPAPADTPTTPT